MAELSPHAKLVLEKRYLLKNEQGQFIETPEELFLRVARAVSAQEGRNKKHWENLFFEMMASLRFLPNSPTLMNAGKPNGQLSACFVLPIEDALESIFDTLKAAALIQQSGGGTGFSFSRLRAKGERVRSTMGTASGPVSFMRLYDASTDIIRQGGTRRGANMAILRVDHPDILEFIDCKLDLKSITNFNISVGATDEFMSAVLSDADFWTKDPQSRRPLKKLAARELFDRLVDSAWRCGDPGIVFLDRMNFFNPTPKQGPFESTNPCGEQPLLPYESCNLGSLSLATYWTERGFNWELFRDDIWNAIRFLDNVIGSNVFPLELSKKVTLKNRKVGLGVMGFADLLLLEGIPYGSSESFARGEKLMSFLDREAKLASADLAKSRGAFPAWKGSLWEKLGYPMTRNATVSTVAPTGTISILAGASSGIEPIFAGVYTRHVLDGEQLEEVHPALKRALEAKKLSPANLTEDLAGQFIGKAWTPSKDVSVEAHIQMQAAFQRHSDSAVSKTVNLPRHATHAEVAAAYELAFELGCKGITVYRDESRGSQVLQHGHSGQHQIEGEDCPKCVS